MQELTFEQTLQVGGAVAEYSRMDTVGISTLSAATVGFGLGIYNGVWGAGAAGFGLATLSSAATAALVTGAATIPVTIAFMVGKQLYTNHYGNRVTVVE